jgi:hypothetical protein
MVKSFKKINFFHVQDKRPTGVINLVGITVERVGKKNFAILIVQKNGVGHALRGDNDKISITWHTELCNLISQPDLLNT